MTTTPLDTTLMEELTTSVGGCIGTLEMALAVTKDENAQRALIACLSVLATSHEHLCRVDAMVFSHEGKEAPAGPLTMGQPEDENPNCLHLDLTELQVLGALHYMCRACGCEVHVAEPAIERHQDVAAAAELEAVIAEHYPGRAS